MLSPCSKACFSECAGDAGNSTACLAKVNQCKAADDAGTDAAIADSGVTVSDAGSVLTGTLAFEVRTATSYARLNPDGGTDFNNLAVALVSVVHQCRDPMSPLTGPGFGLVLEAFGTPALGTFQSTGSNVYRLVLNADGGAPTSVEYLSGSFTLGAPGNDPTKGLTGTLALTSADGGTLNGSFSAPYCGAY
jgi:hypothetical protein